jgi:hypothetical protein
VLELIQKIKERFGIYTIKHASMSFFVEKGVNEIILPLKDFYRESKTDFKKKKGQ